jgi:hypothetical protein
MRRMLDMKGYVAAILLLLTATAAAQEPLPRHDPRTDPAACARDYAGELVEIVQGTVGFHQPDQVFALLDAVRLACARGDSLDDAHEVLRAVAAELAARGVDVEGAELEETR